MNRYRPIIIAAALFLGACGGLDTARTAFSEGGAKVMDQALTDAEWVLCYGASIGSIKRRYGGGRAGAYNELCDRGGGGIVK